jgi:hypothetical protein
MRPRTQLVPQNAEHNTIRITGGASLISRETF